MKKNKTAYEILQKHVPNKYGLNNNWINAMEEYANQSKWVSVEERLPEEHNEFYWHHAVRIFAELPTGQKLNIDAQWTKNKRFVHNGIDLTEYVTHWQPLPTPPKQS